MALPLLLGVGAGILGGAQYLLKKADDKRAASMLDHFESMPAIPGLTGPQSTAMYMGEAGRIMQDQGFFDATKSQRMEALTNSYMQAYAGGLQAQQQAEQRYQQNNANAITDLRQIEADASQRYAGIQGTMRTVENLISSGNFTHQDLYAVVYQMAEALDPGAIKTEDDINNIIANNSFLSRASATISNWTGGEAPDEIGRNIYNTMQELYKTEKVKYDQNQRDFRAAEKRYYDKGYLGGDDSALYDLSYGVTDYAPGMLPPPGGTPPPIPPGFREE